MKKNTKGFTLIELLAVIVILAIIALIATPIVLNLINTARMSAAARGAEGIRSSLQKQYYAQMALNPSSVGTQPKIIEFDGSDKDITGWTIDGETVKLSKIIDGKLPTAGKVTVATDGAVTTTEELVIDGFYCSFGANGSATCNKTARS